MTTIVIAEDHHVVREGLRAFLARVEGFSVLGEAADGLQAVDLVARLEPDVLLLDLMMPGLNGLEVARRVPGRSPKTRVVILSMYSSEAYVREALRNGASGYVLKECDSAQLVQAIREAAQGRRYLCPVITARAIEAYADSATGAAPDRYDLLTTREREVLQLAAEGGTNARVAERLAISPRTAEVHRANVLRKLRLKTQTDLVRYALRRGIIALDP